MTADRIVDLPRYRVIIGTDVVERLADVGRSAAPAHRYAIITDTNVGPIHAERVQAMLDPGRAPVFTIPAGESFKTRDVWASLTDELLAADLGRDTTVVALGGGVVGDLAGFVAATFMRGIPYIQVPTSLLAMVDASVGGKTGVDTPAGKNLVGAFHQPAAVIADMRFLETLPANQLRAGMAEVIKHGVIADSAYFDAVSDVLGRLESVDVSGDLMAGVVARSVEIKADVVRRDEREMGMRKTLNFGHTIGHAIEQCSGYAMLHGEAVAAGMVHESALAERLGVAEAGTAARVRAAVRAAGLPERRPASISVDAILDAARADKKSRAGRVEYALPLKIGAMAAAHRGWSMPVSDDAVREILA